jgi:protein-S-isoprenylcysteine O-methyltransferase Ste14
MDHPDSLFMHTIRKNYLRIPGIVLITLGLIIFISGIISFRNSWRIGIDKNSSDDLITTGIFSYTRNPIFLFINLYFIGTALIYPTLFFIVFAVISMSGIHYHIKAEERFLKSHYGKPYFDYLKKVRRYI